MFGNSAPVFPHAPKRPRDPEDISLDLGISEPNKHAILSYPLPDQQRSDSKHVPFTYLRTEGATPICGTAHNVASEEMLGLSSTSGAAFDECVWNSVCKKEMMLSDVH